MRKVCQNEKNVLPLHPHSRFRKPAIILRLNDKGLAMVRWMSGLVPGLQNRSGRFDSATHLSQSP